MTGFDGIRGHERPLKVLRRALASGRIAHAYLFWGPDGIGKEMTARAMAAILLCRSPEAAANAAPCGVCPSCRKTASGNHPDLYVLSPGEMAISVEEVRSLQQNLSFQAYEKWRKVAIIRDAFRMSREGANALLKTVEEPPQDTFLFLLAPHRSRLLPTLVSRCQSLRFDPLAARDVEAIVEAGGIAHETAARLAALSGGSPGAALALDPESIGEVEKEAGAVSGELDKMTLADRFDLSERWSKDKEGLELKLQCLERFLAEKARSSETAAARLERLGLVRGLIERNVNLQLALDALFVLDAGGGREEIL